MSKSAILCVDDEIYILEVLRDNFTKPLRILICTNLLKVPMKP
jgi:hypothetical protein